MNPDPMAPVVLFFDTEYSQRDSAHCAPISLALVARGTVADDQVSTPIIATDGMP